ncbi:TIGR02302 family protein [Albidovulum sp.]
MSRIRTLPPEALKRLKWPLRLTRWGMAAERITRRFWPVWTILLGLIAALAFGVQDVLPAGALAAGGGVVLLALAVALARGARGFRWPTRAEALARIDARLPGRPIAALEDELALGAADAGTWAVWRAHVARMAERAAAAPAVLPDLRLARHDPFALRYVALTAFVIALLFGTLGRVAEVKGVLGAGQRQAGAPVATWEAWAEPPAYTGRPGLYLNKLDDPAFELPEGSRIVVRLYGPAAALGLEESLSGAAPAAAGQGEGAAAPAGGQAAAELRAIEIVVRQSGRLAIRGEGGRGWRVEVLPDRAPEVRVEGLATRRPDGAMAQEFSARDDYGVVSGQARIEIDLDAVPRRYGLAVAPEPRDPLVFDLPLPITGSRAEFTETLVEDASRHPWANLPVRMVFEVADGKGQTGASEPVRLDLPGRRFFDPVAAAVIELRRDLLWNRANGRRVSQILHAITHRPEGLLRNERAYLMLRVAMRRLDGALAQGPLSAGMRDEIAEAFWQIAELIEDGGLADALERMRQAQERLSEAIRNGASPEEIQKLMDDLRQATDDYIRQLAENMQRRGADEPNRQAENGQTLTGDQLQQMMDEIQRLMEEGRMAEAQELLDQLSRMMENLRVTEGQGGQDQQGPGQRALENLRQTLRDQQGLSDEAFRELQRQFGQQGQGQGQQNPQGGQGQAGNDPLPGQRPDGGEGGGRAERRPGAQGDPSREGPGGGEAGSLADRQQSLRETLRRQQGGLPGDPSAEAEAARRALDEAGRAMDGAEQALRRGDMAEAIERQAEAIENLREGMRSLGEALARNQSDQLGGQGETATQSGREVPRDPLGRSAGEFGRLGTNENLLQGEDVYRRARDLLDEIRRRSGERDRPQEELDYLRRLLDRF